MSQSCRHDVFDPTSTIRLRSDSEGVFVRCAECNKAQHWTADYDDDTEPTAGPTAVERAVCPHGSLRRQCEVCERDEEIARLAKKLRIAELKASGTLATNLCPDHHDKQLGKPCLACEIERLNKWADGFADRQLEERRTAEAYQRELRAEIDRLRAELKAATESEYAFCVERDQLRAEVARLQARIDALMLEYCPGEMTPEQTAEWARHQVPHQLTAEDREALEHAPAAEETPASQQWPCINWPCQLPSGHQGPSVSSAESEEPSHG